MKFYGYYEVMFRFKESIKFDNEVYCQMLCQKYIWRKE